MYVHGTEHHEPDMMFASDQCKSEALLMTLSELLPCERAASGKQTHVYNFGKNNF